MQNYSLQVFDGLRSVYHLTQKLFPGNSVAGRHILEFHTLYPFMLKEGFLGFIVKA
jgi:hypothetical protein